MFDDWQGQHICSWPGVVCDAGGRAVLALELAGRGLRGRLSPALAALRTLRTLRAVDLSHNALTGRLPDAWAAPPRLQALDLRGIRGLCAGAPGPALAALGAALGPRLLVDGGCAAALGRGPAMTAAAPRASVGQGGGRFDPGVGRAILLEVAAAAAAAPDPPLAPAPEPDHGFGDGPAPGGV